MKKRETILTALMFLLLLMTIGASYMRFVVNMDYIVSFEGDCDPFSESCFYDCEDDECTTDYYFTRIERKAYEVYELCGTTNVLECDVAYECSPDVEFCRISYCDPEVEGDDYCEALGTTDL
jgi:hypothetical protein